MLRSHRVIVHHSNRKSLHGFKLPLKTPLSFGALKKNFFFLLFTTPHTNPKRMTGNLLLDNIQLNESIVHFSPLSIFCISATFSFFTSLKSEQILFAALGPACLDDCPPHSNNPADGSSKQQSRSPHRSR